MAEKLTPKSAGKANIGHNVGDIKDVVREVDRDLAPLEAQKEDIMAKMRDVKSRLKKYDIKMSDFKAARRLAQMESDEERQDRIDKFTICLEAFGVTGPQMTMFEDSEEEDLGDGDPASLH